MLMFFTENVIPLLYVKDKQVNRHVAPTLLFTKISHKITYESMCMATSVSVSLSNYLKGENRHELAKKFYRQIFTDSQNFFKHDSLFYGVKHQRFYTIKMQI